MKKPRNPDFGLRGLNFVRQELAEHATRLSQWNVKSVTLKINKKEKKI